MSREPGDREEQSRGSTQRGCDPGAGCSAPYSVASISCAVGMRAAANTAGDRHDVPEMDRAAKEGAA